MRYVYHWTVASTMDIWRMVGLWMKNVSGDTPLSLQYDRSWLASDLLLIWLKTYNLLRQSDERKWFQLLFSLPAMAYTSSNLSELVPMLMAFASHLLFPFEDPLHYDSYPTVEGCYPSLDTLRTYVIDCAYSLEPKPEMMEGATYRESFGTLKQGQHQMYNSKQRLDANATAQELFNAWLCETSLPCSLNPNLYDVANLESKVQLYFSSRFHNLKLQEHLTHVQVILDNLYSQASPNPDPLPYAFHPSRTC